MGSRRDAVKTVAGWLDRGWRVLITAFSWSIFGSGVVVWAVAVLPVMAGVAFLFPAARHRVTDVTQRAIALFVRLLPFVRIEVDARRRLASGSKVVVVNHQSFLDPLIVFSVEPRVRGPARGYLFRTPFLRSYLRFAGFYVSDRGHPAPLEKMRCAAEDVLECGGSLLFYPEGTRSRTGELDEFGVGAFRVAYEYGLPIQPIVVEGLDRAYPSGSIVVKTRWRSRVRVRYLDPISPPFGEGPQRQVVRALALLVRAKMAEELQEMRDSRDGDAPSRPLIQPVPPGYSTSKPGGGEPPPDLGVSRR
jgi:1-acyl-sn-glycerol-3-phosphate acyltransferase